MQLSRPNKIQRPGVRLHPKACAALALEAERATPKCNKLVPMGGRATSSLSKLPAREDSLKSPTQSRA